MKNEKILHPSLFSWHVWPFFLIKSMFPFCLFCGSIVTNSRNCICIRYSSPVRYTEIYIKFPFPAFSHVSQNLWDRPVCAGSVKGRRVKEKYAYRRSYKVDVNPTEYRGEHACVVVRVGRYFFFKKVNTHCSFTVSYIFHIYVQLIRTKYSKKYLIVFNRLFKRAVLIFYPSYFL